jgi:AcrR family transcriptional regulator
MAEPPKRIRRERAETIHIIFGATRELMLAEGYAAVSTRAVAKAAGLTPALVHYYFPTTDDLLVGLYRHASEDYHLRIIDALQEEQPAQALWRLHTDAEISALAIEFLALANHRKTLRAEVIRLAEHSRRLQVKVLRPFLQRTGLDPSRFPEHGIAALFQGMARSLVLEQGVGITLGVADGKAIVQHMLEWLESRTSGEAEP